MDLPIGERIARSLWDLRDAVLETRWQVRDFWRSWVEAEGREDRERATRAAVALQRRRRR